MKKIGLADAKLFHFDRMFHNGVGWGSREGIRLNPPEPPLDLPLDIIEPCHQISNNVVCATSKASDQPAHTRSLIKAFASRLNIL